MRLRSILFCLGALAAAVATPAAADEVLKAMTREPALRPAKPSWREGELIVAFREIPDAHDMEAALRVGKARSATASRFGRRFLVRLQPGDSVREAAARFSRMPEVLYAEPNGILRATADTFVPNDRLYRFQWNLKQLNAERTWAIQKGSSSVAVAVLDTGVAYEDYRDPRTGIHYAKAPDWGETVFLPGFDFVNHDDHPNDDHYHGTHIASTIAEATNNSTGTAGIAFGCALLPVKVLDANGEGDFFTVAEGIDFAVNFEQNGRKPVKVINLSLGAPITPGSGGSEAATVTAAVDRAVAAGVLVVAAGGNSADPVIEFPANLPNVVAVGAVDALEQRASYSNTGADLDVVAPGGDCEADADADGEPDCIWQQMPDFDLVNRGIHDQFCYCGLDGTSMATAHVSAVAALLFSQGFSDVAAVRAALEQSAKHLGASAGRNDTYGFGLVQPADVLPGLGLATNPKP